MANKVNQYKEHMVMPCAYFFVDGMKNANLHKYVERLVYVDSDYKANTLTVDIKDKDYLLINQMLRSKKVYAMFGYKAKVLEFNGYIAKINPSFKSEVNLSLFCMDNSYPLTRNERSRTWSNCRRCDVVKKIAIEHGLNPVVETVGKVQEKISQVNETDMQFLQKLAEEETGDSIGTATSGGINQVMYIAKVKGNSLYFQPRKLSSESLRTLWYNINDCSIISMTPSEATNTTSSTPKSKANKGGLGSPTVNDLTTEVAGSSEEDHLRKFHDDELTPMDKFLVTTQQWQKIYKQERE